MGLIKYKRLEMPNHTNIIQSINKFKELNIAIAKISSYEKKISVFNEFVKAYLITSHLHNIKSIYMPGLLKSSIKKNLSKKLQENLSCIGAFETLSGEMHLFYSKYLLEGEELSWSDISDFVTSNDKFNKLLITNSDYLPEKILSSKKSFYSICRHDFDKLSSNDIKRIKGYSKGEVVNINRFTPLPHQKNSN